MLLPALRTALKNSSRWSWLNLYVRTYLCISNRTGVSAITDSRVVTVPTMHMYLEQKMATVDCRSGLTSHAYNG